MEKELRTLLQGKHIRLARAVEFAIRAHRGQKRHSGETYVSHPIWVMQQLCGHGFPLAYCIAAVLHDVVEDTVFRVIDLEERFGRKVAFLVNAMTDYHKTSDLTRTDRKIRYYSEFDQAVQRDPLLIFIKLFDRLHNLTTMKTLPSERQERLKQDTSGFLLPICLQQELRIPKKYRQLFLDLVEQLRHCGHTPVAHPKLPHGFSLRRFLQASTALEHVAAYKNNSRGPETKLFITTLVSA